MPDDIKSLTWLTDPHLEFCSHLTRKDLYQSINHAAGEIVVITGDLSAGPHRLAQYVELAEKVRKPIYFVLGNHDRYGTTFANTEAVVKRVTTQFSHLARLDGSQLIPLNESVALIGVDGWADGLAGEGPATKARINDFYQILDFATEPEPQAFQAMKNACPQVRSSSQAVIVKSPDALSDYDYRDTRTSVRRRCLARRFTELTRLSALLFFPDHGPADQDSGRQAPREECSGARAAIPIRPALTAPGTSWYSLGEHATAFLKSIGPSTWIG